LPVMLMLLPSPTEASPIPANRFNSSMFMMRVFSDHSITLCPSLEHELP
jgi:hypothetical protein